MKIKNRRRLRDLLSTSLMCWLFLSCACDNPESRRQLEFLQQLAAKTPLFPGFEQLRSSDLKKIGRVTVVRCYTARAKYEDVKRFYSEFFLGEGWTHPVEERLGGFHTEGSAFLTFRKGNYSVVIQYENLDDPSSKCNYSISYVWSE